MSMKLTTVHDIHSHGIDKSWEAEPGLLVEIPRGLLEVSAARIRWVFTDDSEGSGAITLWGPVNSVGIRQPFTAHFGSPWAEAAPQWLKTMVEDTRSEARLGAAPAEVPGMKLTHSSRTRNLSRKVEVSGCSELLLEGRGSVKSIVPATVMFMHKIIHWRDAVDGEIRLWSAARNYAQVTSPKPGQLPEELYQAYLQTYADLSGAELPAGWSSHVPVP